MTCCKPVAASKRSHLMLSLLGALIGSSLLSAPAAAANFPITTEQRDTAGRVAQAGVPLSELSPNAPDSHTVKAGDTLWHISSLFLKSPWRWPELWGMNMEQIRNPHLIYPGQVLLLVKVDGRARLQLAQNLGGATASSNVRLSPQIRSSAVDKSPITSLPLHLIAPFLNEAVVFDSDALNQAPRIVAAQEGRVLLSRGDVAYVRGDLSQAREYRLFRQPKPLLDPGTREILGYEAGYLGTAEHTRAADEQKLPDGKTREVPATITITSIRQEVGVGDRLAPIPPREFTSYAPHSPDKPISGQLVSIYGEALTAGQNQIVALNRGARDGVERGHVLALWRAGRTVIDATDPKRPELKLPDERHGLLFVFRVFERVSYALILSVQEPVKPGDAFSQP